MPTLLLIAYDGTELAGCPEVPGRRTVVGVLREALARVDVRGALETLSRTDAGVHARGQVAVLDGGRAFPEDRLLLALDRHLPPDVRCRGVARVPRVPAAAGKTYRYTLDLSRWGDPFLARRAWRVRVDPDALVATAEGLVGAHDLGAFRRRGETRVDLRRRIDEARWEVRGDVATFVIRGEGFPYRLVRSLVGAMVHVARGAARQDDLRAALAGASSGVARQQAPARGLLLDRITLDPSPTWVGEGG